MSALVRPAQDLSPRVRRVPAVRRAVAWWRRERYPSYLPSRAVVSALLDLDVGARARGAARPLDEAIEAVPSERVKDALAALLADVHAHAGKAEDEVALFRTAAETWYDDTMARVSGWYKRRVQLVLWLIGLTVAIVLNVDTVNIARVLWADDTVRAALVAQAEQASEEGAALDAARLEQLDIPLGWRFGSDGSLDVPSRWEDWLSKAIGVLITSAALSMGAPFWFDLLGKVARLPSAGAPPPSRKATEAGP